MRKILSAILALAMIFSMMPATFALESENVGAYNSLKLPVVNEVGEESKVSLMSDESLHFQSEYYSFGSSDEWTSLWMDESVASMLPADLSGTGCTLSFCFKDPTNTVVTTMGGIPVEDLWIDNWEGVCYGGEIYFMLNLIGVRAGDYSVDVTLYDSNGTAYNLGSADMVVTDKNILRDVHIINYDGELTPSTKSFYVSMRVSGLFTDYDSLKLNLLDQDDNVVAQTTASELYSIDRYSGTTVLYQLTVDEPLYVTDYDGEYTLEILSKGDLELISDVGSIYIRVTDAPRVIRSEFLDKSTLRIYTENIASGDYILHDSMNGNSYSVYIGRDGVGSISLPYAAEEGYYYYFILYDGDSYIASVDLLMPRDDSYFYAFPGFLAADMTEYEDFHISVESALEEPSADRITYAHFTQNGEVVATMTDLVVKDWYCDMVEGNIVVLSGTVSKVAGATLEEGYAVFEIKYDNGFVYQHKIPVATTDNDLYGYLQLDNTCYYYQKIGDYYTYQVIGGNQASFTIPNTNATIGTVSLYEMGVEEPLETLKLSDLSKTVYAGAYYTYHGTFDTILSEGKAYDICFTVENASQHGSNFTIYSGKLLEQTENLKVINGIGEVYCYSWLNISDISDVEFTAVCGDFVYELPVLYEESNTKYCYRELDFSEVPEGNFRLMAHENGRPITLTGNTVGYHYADIAEPLVTDIVWREKENQREYLILGANLDQVKSASIAVYKSVEFSEGEGNPKLQYVKDITIPGPYQESSITIDKDLLSDLDGGYYTMIYFIDGKPVDTQAFFIEGEESDDTPVVPPVVNPDEPTDDPVVSPDISEDELFDMLASAPTLEEFMATITDHQDELIAFDFEELYFNAAYETMMAIAEECYISTWESLSELCEIFNKTTIFLCFTDMIVSDAVLAFDYYDLDLVFEEYSFLSMNTADQTYIHDMMKKNTYITVAQVEDAFREAVILQQINNATSDVDLKEIALRYGDTIGLDWSVYNTLTNQDAVWKMLMGAYYGSFSEFVASFNNAVASLNVPSAPSGGGSSGSTSGFWIYEAKAEKGLLCVSAASADFIPEDSAVMLAVYEEKQNRLVTLQQINLSDCEHEGGYYKIAEEIPFDKLGKFRIKMMVWDSLDTMQTVYQAPEYIFDAVYEKEPTVVTLTPEQICEVDFYRMRYYDENGVLKTIKFSDCVTMSVNGETLSYFDSDVFYSDTVETIVCTDLDSDNYFDNVSVTEVQTFVVDYMEDDTIYAIESAYCVGSWYLELYDVDYTITDDDGNTLELSDIKKNDILKIYRKADVIDIIVTGKKVTGLVTKVKETADDFIVYIGESAYYLGNFRWCNYYPKPGEYVTIVVDETNQIFRIKGELTGFSAAVLLAQNETSDFNPQLQLMVKQGEETKILEVANEVVIDDRYFMEYDASYYLYRGELLLYRTNAKGEIDKIYTSSANNDLKHAYGVSPLDFYADPLQFLDMKLGDYIFTATTQIYMVDGREMSEDNLYSVSPTQLLNGARYVGEGFVNEDGELLTVLLYSEESQFFNPMQVPFVVAETSYIYDDGEVKTQLDGYINGVKETLIISPECDSYMYLSIGSAILYTKNFDGEVSDYEILIDGNNIYGESYGSMISGLVDRIEEGKLYFADDPYNGYAVDESVVAYRYIPRTRTLKVVPIYDVETYSNDYYCDDAFSYYSYNDKILMYYIIDQDGDNDMPIELPEGYTTEFTVRQMSGNTIYIAEADDMIPGKLVLDASVESVFRKENGEEVTKLSKGDKVTLKVMKNLSSYKLCYYFTVKSDS